MTGVHEASPPAPAVLLKTIPMGFIAGWKQEPVEKRLVSWHELKFIQGRGCFPGEG